MSRRASAGAASAALFVALALPPAGTARALSLDPTLAQRFSTSAPRLATRSSAVRLAPELTLAWRVRVAGGILHAPIARDDGAVIVPHTLPSLGAYGPDGRLLWTARLGAAPAAASPILLGDGSLLVLTESADAIWLSPRGSALRRTALPLGGLERPPALAALGNGAVLLSEGRRLLRLDAAGGVTYAKRLDEEIVGLLGEPGDPALVTAGGGVFVLSADGRLSRRGALGGRVDALARLDARRIAAVLDGRRLAELDLASESVTLTFADANLELSSALAANGAADLRILAGGDWFLAFSAGREQFRVALPGSGGAPRGAASELLVDPLGRALVVRASADALSVAPDGALARVDGTACPEPLRPTALPSGGAVLACRSGVLARVGARAQ